MAKPKSSDKIKTASVLSFNRHLDCSDGRMTAVLWGERDLVVKPTIKGQEKEPAVPAYTAIKVIEKAVRGTISNRPKIGKETDPAAINALMEVPNLQRVDIAALPQGTDTLALTFSLRVLPNVGSPSACNDTGFAERLTKVVESYRAVNDFAELAQRYAISLACGRFLWRNRVGAEQVEVRVSRLVDGHAKETLTFNALDYPLAELQTSAQPRAEIATLARWIQAGFLGQEHVLLKVVGYARMGEGQEVYPSQELVLDQDKGSKTGKKSKFLYTLPDGVAGLHSQKIGNALRTIDNWYPDANKPIAVEPYGSVTSEYCAYRQPSAKVDFYNLFDDWVNKDKLPELNQQHYVMAVLIRGGVFGESDSK